MKKSNRGRKAKLFPQSEIDQIVQRFVNEKRIDGIVKPMEVYRFSVELYNNNEIEYKLSEDYWRKPNRQGTVTIAKFNQVLEHTVESGTDEIERIIDTQDAINKHFTGKQEDKNKLISLLKMNESKAKRYMNKNKVLQTKVRNLEVSLAEQKDKTQEWKGVAENLEQVLFALMDYSVDSDVPLVNMMTTGKSRSKPVNKLFDTIFSEPTAAYKFEEFQKQRHNLVSIKDGKQKSAFDDIDF
ncbi:hypothetical protein [Bacillus sp. PS06]|uniref:hypothetical protein n=1 Tax=Bacillus sp. PS06 TaxID=2764176 RepID=UPI00178047BB|nr:hypothetical protein [Bacillus sp. PS06]MBD8071280.1 hypothetical protein [Bacillus sp. PS06]